MFDRLHTVWIIFQNWRRFRARMRAYYLTSKDLGVIPPLYPFGLGEECPTCHCVFDIAGPIGNVGEWSGDWQRPGCHCVCHD